MHREHLPCIKNYWKMCIDSKVNNSKIIAKRGDTLRQGVYVRIPEKLNILDNIYIYIFGILYIQILELILPIRVSKILFLLLMFQVAVGIARKRYKIGIGSIIVFCVSAIYLLLYVIFCRGAFSSVYPVAFLAMFSPVILNNLSVDVGEKYWKTINIYILVYLLMNIVLYLIGPDKCFQIEANVLHFKGALPHSNMYCAVLMGLYICTFWQKGLLTWVNRLLELFLIMSTGSRTYILIIFLLIGLKILASDGYQSKFILKCAFLFVPALFLLQPVWNLLVEHVPAMARFKVLSFNSNGRQPLWNAMIEAVNLSDFIDVIWGLPVTKKYLEIAPSDYSHSFTENSYAGIFLLFGIIGVSLFIIIILKILSETRNLQTVCVILASLLTLLVQDTLISFQTGMILFAAIVVMVRQNKLMLQERREFYINRRKQIYSQESTVTSKMIDVK